MHSVNSAPSPVPVFPVAYHDPQNELNGLSHALANPLEIKGYYNLHSDRMHPANSAPSPAPVFPVAYHDPQNESNGLSHALGQGWQDVHGRFAL